MDSKTALVVGGGGLIGGHCLKLLLDRAEYGRVVALGRRRLKLEHPKLVQHVVDFDKRETFEPFLKTDDVFSCVGTTRAKSHDEESYYKADFDVPYDIARLSVESGAKRFLIVTSVGADSKARSFYLRLKGEIEAAVSKLPFEAVHLFRPSLLLGARTEQRRFEGFIQGLAPVFSLVCKGPLSRYAPVSGETVAAAMVAAALSDPRGIHVHEYDSILALARSAGARN